jgi:hypothetical protein
MGFFAGSTVLMANGRQKPIEELQFGDEVIDILGQTQTVDGIRILQYSKIGFSYLINGKYLITANHYFFSADNKMYNIWSNNRSPHPGNEIVCLFPYNTEKNKIKYKWHYLPAEDTGLVFKFYDNDPRWQDVYLKTINGSEKIETLEEKDMTSEDTLYLHSVTGSGTYFVNGLCVAARINETWDYANMKPFDGVVTMVSDDTTRTHKRVIDIDHSTNEHSVWCPEDQHWKNHWRFK